MARPCKELDKEKFEDYCEVHCTITEISNIFDVDTKTLDAWCKRTYEGKGFSEVFKEKSSRGKMSLRHAQFTKAMSGNVPMLIWLGKNWLGQKETVTVDEETMGVVQEIAEQFKKSK